MNTNFIPMTKTPVGANVPTACADPNGKVYEASAEQLKALGYLMLVPNPVSTVKKSLSADYVLSISADLNIPHEDDYFIKLSYEPISIDVTINLLDRDIPFPVADIPCSVFLSAAKGDPSDLACVMDSDSAECGEIGYQVFDVGNHTPGTILCLGNNSPVLSEARAKVFGMDFSLASILDGIACAFNRFVPDKYKVAYIAVLADAEEYASDQFWLDEFKKMKKKGRIIHCNKSLVGCEPSTFVALYTLPNSIEGWEA